MVAHPRSSRLIPIAAAAGVATFVAITATVFAIPTGLLESFVVDSGIASLAGPAEPPLGRTAHAILALGFGGMAGAVVWSALFLLIGTRSVALRRRRRAGGDVPTVRRADAHPDAPPRRPVFANSDLGAPLMTPAAESDGTIVGRPIRAARAIEETEDEAIPVAAEPVSSRPSECPLPRDLDVPLAAFDPAAILPVPREPVRPVEPLARAAEPEAEPELEPATSDPVERIETFELTPMVRTAPVAAPAMPGASIESLLERLERGARRAAPQAEPRAPVRPEPRTGSLEDTLAALRQLATRTA